MKKLKRIIFEIVIIASVFAAVNLYYSKSKAVLAASDDKPAIGMQMMGSPGVFTTPKEVDYQTAMKWLNAWKKSGFKIKGRIPGLGYDSKTMKLIPLDIPAGLIYSVDPSLLRYASQAWLRNSVVSSTNDLEKRIRKLENTVNRIMAKCCPEAKEK